MSRVANAPIQLAENVSVEIRDKTITVKGVKGELTHEILSSVRLEHTDKELQVIAGRQKSDIALAGTTRALLQNMVTGVSDGFERKLEIIGVGYRAQVKGKSLSLSLGFSHPVDFPIPDGIDIQTPSQTEIVVRGIDKQQVSQVAANIRRYRPPEPYKGKGVRYLGERVLRKEAKKT